MSEKNKENQGVRTVDLVFCCVLFGAAVSICYTIISETFAGDKPQQARVVAENLAIQIADRNDHSRAPASENDAAQSKSNALVQGQIGRDPWGRSYQYKTVSETASASKRVVVWSAGPNGQFDTSELAFEYQDIQKTAVFAADDIGYIYQVD